MTLLADLMQRGLKPHHVAVVAHQVPSEPVDVDPAGLITPPQFKPQQRSVPEGYAGILARIQRELVAGMDPEQATPADASADSAAMRRQVEEDAEARLAEADSTIPRRERRQMAVEIADEVLGFGPLAPLLRDPSVTEIIVNGFDQVYYERAGRLHPADCSFRDDAHVLQIVERILWPIGRRLDFASPMVDARLPDGSRMNAIISPLSLFGPAITIRKFSQQFLCVDDLVSHGTLTESAATFLAACVRGRLNILVSGGTGSGKTTLLNTLSAFVPSHERIITIEDPAELQIRHRDRVCLETRPANTEGKGAVGQRDLLKNALRMRPDRIIVGECRGAEAFDMLQAMNTGHDGSLTTVHANSPRDALARVQNMVLMAVDLPVEAIREQIVSGINLVVHLARQPDGSRKVTHISEILPLRDAIITTQDLFRLQSNDDGAQELRPTGLPPHFTERLAQAGQQLADTYEALAR